ncbi:unnamed protein product, partial [Ectocarpus sp. 8 AP-2014]
MKLFLRMGIIGFWPIDAGERPFAHTPRISVLGPERQEKEQPSRRCSAYSTWQTGGLKLNHAHQLESEW